MTAVDQARAYVATIGDPATRSECAQVIATVAKRGQLPAWRTLSPCARVTARILDTNTNVDTDANAEHKETPC